MGWFIKGRPQPSGWGLHQLLQGVTPQPHFATWVMDLTISISLLL